MNVEQIQSINIAQQKLLGSAVRVKILHAVNDTPRTVKQLSDLLGETPGNVHYHIQRLLDGNLIELVETKNVNGIVEKYYKSYSIVFQNYTHPRPGVETQLLLSKEDVKQLKVEIAELLSKWERQTTFRKITDNVKEMLINVDIIEIQKDSDNE